MQRRPVGHPQDDRLFGEDISRSDPPEKAIEAKSGVEGYRGRSGASRRAYVRSNRTDGVSVPPRV